MGEGRALRADAERNRAAILAVAGDVYARGGTEISLDEVARLAGVGVGTLYRRFPSKDALLDALFEERMTEYVVHAEAARQLAVTEPWRAFREHLEFLAERQSSDLGFSEILRNPSRGSEAFQELHRRALRASIGLVKHARAAGVLREDFRHADLLLATNANHGVVSAHPGSASAASRRLIALMLDAFARPADARTAPTRADSP